MSDQATTTPVYKANTFSAVQDSISTFEQNQQTQQQENTDNNNQNPDATTTENQNQAVETVTDNQQTQEQIDTSNFTLELPNSEQEAESDKQQQPQEQAASFNWKEEIKKIDKNELLKEVGLHDFAIEIDEHLKKGGQAIDYLNAKVIDYNKIDDDSLLKEDLKKQYPNFTAPQIDLLFNRKYGTSDANSDEDNEFISLQKQADAYKLRQDKISEQQKFKIPETPVLQKDEAYEQWKQNIEAQNQMLKELNEFYQNHEATKKLNESKRVTISLGDNVPPFNFLVDKPELITQAFTDGGKTLQKFTSTPQGEPDIEKQQLIVLFSANPQKFMRDVFNYGKQMGVRKELVEEGQNAQRPQAKVAPMDANAKPVYGVGKFGDKAR